MYVCNFKDSLVICFLLFDKKKDDLKTLRLIIQWIGTFLKILLEYTKSNLFLPTYSFCDRKVMSDVQTALQLYNIPNL